jgi:hypothetical protein
MGCQHDGIELRHQFFTLGESQSQNYVGGRVDALVRNQAMRSYMLTSTMPRSELDEIEWELERFVVMLPWFASVSDASEGRGFVFLRDGGE